MQTYIMAKVTESKTKINTQKHNIYSELQGFNPKL